MSLCLSQTNLGTTNMPSANTFAGARKAVMSKIRKTGISFFVKILVVDFVVSLSQTDLAGKYSRAGNLTRSFRQATLTGRDDLPVVRGRAAARPYQRKSN